MVHPIFSEIMDRFSYGLPDAQDAKVMANCQGCGNEIYEDEYVFVINGGILHRNSDCLELYLNPQSMTIEQALGR